MELGTGLVTVLGLLATVLTWWLAGEKNRKRERILNEMWELHHAMGQALDEGNSARITLLGEQLRLCRQKYARA